MCQHVGYMYVYVLIATQVHFTARCCAERGYEIASRLSVRPSVRLSVMISTVIT